VLAITFAAMAPAMSRAQGSAALEPQTTLPDVEDEVMCPVCGTTLELASDSPQAIDERDQIRDLIAQGLTKEEIKDELVAEFGPEVLAEPSTEGFDLAAWLVPGLAVIAGAILAFFAVRRWRGNSPPPSGTSGTHAESAEDRERLDDDLKRYEL
jgi:cytochrome c-type biogenesis protein CcmH/NrfF